MGWLYRRGLVSEGRMKRKTDSRDGVVKMMHGEGCHGKGDKKEDIDVREYKIMKRKIDGKGGGAIQT